MDQVIAFLCTIQFVIQFEIINIEHDQCGWLLMLAYMVNTFKCVFAVVQRSKVIGNRCAVCILIQVGIAQRIGGIVTYFFQISEFLWGKVLSVMGCNIEKADNDLIVFERINGGDVFCIQPVALSWSQKVEDVFSGIVEHDQIRGIL